MLSAKISCEAADMTKLPNGGNRYLAGHKRLPGQQNQCRNSKACKVLAPVRISGQASNTVKSIRSCVGDEAMVPTSGKLTGEERCKHRRLRFGR